MLSFLKNDKCFTWDEISQLISILLLNFDEDKLYDDFNIFRVAFPALPKDVSVDQKWSTFFKSADTPQLYKLICFVLSIPVSNACVFLKRVLSHMNALWTDERNHTVLDLVKAELQVHLNY